MSPVALWMIRITVMLATLVFWLLVFRGRYPDRVIGLTISAWIFLAVIGPTLLALPRAAWDYSQDERDRDLIDGLYVDDDSKDLYDIDDSHARGYPPAPDRDRENW